MRRYLRQASAAGILASLVLAAVPGAAGAAGQSRESRSSPLLPTPTRWLALDIPGFHLCGDLPGPELSANGVILVGLMRAVSAEGGGLELDSARPSRVFIFRERGEFDAVLHATSRRYSNEVTGMFVPGADANYIFADGSQGGRPVGIVFHEFVHHWIRSSFGKVPLWFDEGMAEFFRTFVCTDKLVEIGRPIPSYMALLTQATLMPAAELFRVERDSPAYTDAALAPIFYAESWALVHYVLLGRPGHEADWTRFPNLINQGVPPEEAFEQAFELDYQGLAEELQRYVTQEKWPSRRMKPPKSEEPTRQVPVSLSPEAVLCRLGDLVSHVATPDSVGLAGPYFKEALRLSPGLPCAAEGLLKLGEPGPGSGGAAEVLDVEKMLGQLNELLSAQRLEEAIALAGRLAGQTIDPELRQQLIESLAGWRRTLETNRHIELYNRAVNQFNQREDGAALETLDSLLTAVKDPDLKAKAEALRRRIAPRPADRNRPRPR